MSDTKAPSSPVCQDYIPRYGLEISIRGGRYEDVHGRDGFFIECASLFCEDAQISRLRLRPQDRNLSIEDPDDRNMIDFLVGYRGEEVKKFLVYGQLMRPLNFSDPSPMPP